MKISTRSRYGIRALISLALSSDKGPVPLKEIAAKDGIPFMYLQKLAAPLVSGGILRASRGINGGVWLAKPPEEIKLSEVVNILEGPIMPVDCIAEMEDCFRAPYCASREIWYELKTAIDSVLESNTIRDLADRQVKNESLQADMYSI